MFIKFENDNRDTYINKDLIESIFVESTSDNHWQIKIYCTANNSPYPYLFKIETKEQAEKILDAMFSKVYQDNTLLIFGKESGVRE